jgi:hypothetical protein
MQVIWPHALLPDEGGATWSLTDEIRAMDKSYKNVGDGICAGIGFMVCETEAL